MTAPLIANLGPTELILIVLVIVLLFGASKLPELARGSGRALRIFKAETKGLMDDDKEDETNVSSAPTSAAQSQAQLEIEAKQRGGRTAPPRRHRLSSTSPSDLR
jgi:sec-independent protein translocase protein TatA